MSAPVLLFTALLVGLAGCASAPAAPAPEPAAPQPSATFRAPSFDCGGVAPDSIGALVCADAELAALDRQLSAVYGRALTMASDFLRTSPVLRAEQRGWIRRREDCLAAEDPRACVREAYRLRIAELQARYALVPRRGSAVYVCPGPAPGELSVTFFATDPATAVAERDAQIVVLMQEPSASGARYAGRGVLVWTHQGEARVRWGADATETTCLVQTPP